MAVNRQRAGLLASERAVEEVGLAELSSSGSALAAVIAGYFAAAGHSPGVLLAPVTLLVAGVGQSGRAFDGRSVQPGRGAKRPRGLLPGAEIPAASRVALSSSVAAIAVAAAYEGGLSLSPLVKAGVQAAERAGASARAAVLTRVAAVGPAAISEPAFVQPLLRVASPSQGGLLTPTDFSAPDPLDELSVELETSDQAWVEAPWARDAESDDELGEGHALIAVDAHGRFAALGYRKLSGGMLVEDLGLLAPYVAVPVQRGVPRIAPGRRLPSPAPLAIVQDGTSSVIAVLAEPDAIALGAAGTGDRLALHRDPRTRLVSAARGSR